MHIGFLLSHDGAHQVAHALPIALALARKRRDVSVEIFFTEGTIEREVKRMVARLGISQNCRLIPLEGPSRAARIITALLGKAAPLNRISILKRNLERFRRLAALVVPEKTALMLKTRFGLANLRIIHTRHGAGDRAVGFDKASGLFDYVLLPGEKVRDRLQAAGHLKPGRHAVVGYPKFDLMDQTDRRPLFDNGRPTIVYNPHPAAGLSSWFRMGPQILEYFAQNRDYNLIFAPHVMLFAKRLSISLSPLSAAWVKGIPKRYRSLPHMLIDTGSQASVDMRYTMAADIYLGDASSQVYEFLARPRPCIFFDAHGQQWRDNPDFAHWAAGPVVTDIAGLDKALRDAVANPASHAEAQQSLFRYSFDLSSTPSADRAADAILTYLEPAGEPSITSMAA
jgi:hypothetical protein